MGGEIAGIGPPEVASVFHISLKTFFKLFSLKYYMTITNLGDVIQNKSLNHVGTNAGSTK